MSASDDTLNTLTAQWYNSLVAGLSLSAKDFQLAQGDLMVPATTDKLWSMMDQVPVESIAQFYSSSAANLFSTDYTNLVSGLKEPASEAFKDAMGDNYAAWQTAEQAYFAANADKLMSNPPMSLSRALTTYFDEWSMVNMDPGLAASCYTLYAAIYENPVRIALILLQHKPAGTPAAYATTQAELIADIANGPTRSFSMSSSTQSSDLDNSWASSSSSAGGTYFYSTSSSSEATDFTQKFATSNVTVTTTYQHMITVPVVPLSSGTATDDAGQELRAWCYPGAITAAWQDDTGSTWQDPTKWPEYFGPTGAMQYIVTGLIVVDGITTAVTSDATYSAAEQKYAHDEEHESYGCWPYYVTHDDSHTTSSNSTFDDAGHMTTTTTSQTGHPVVIGMLVSAVKNIETVAEHAESVEAEAEPAE